MGATHKPLMSRTAGEQGRRYILLTQRSSFFRTLFRLIPSIILPAGLLTERSFKDTSKEAAHLSPKMLLSKSRTSFIFECSILTHKGFPNSDTYFSVRE